MDSYNTVTYHFADGTKQVCAINPQVLYGERGRRRAMHEIESVFATTAHDLGATSFEI